MQYAYRVNYGEGVRRQYHYVSKKRVCHCSLGAECPSVQVVEEYLRNGGTRTPDYPETYWPEVPEKCPVCGAACAAHERYNFPTHGKGWACSQGGTLHYWEALAAPIRRAAQAARPEWVIPPVQDETGTTVYPGVTRAGIEAAKADVHLARLAWAVRGYSPQL